MKIKDFSQHLKQIEEVSSRISMTKQLSKLFSQLSKEEIPPASYMMQGRLVPNYLSLEFNMSVKMVLRVLARFEQSQGSEVDLFGEVKNDDKAIEQVTKHYKKLGDVGLLAEEVVGDAKHKDKQLSVLSVFEKLTEIAKASGEGSQEKN